VGQNNRGHGSILDVINQATISQGTDIHTSVVSPESFLKNFTFFRKMLGKFQPIFP